MGYAHKRYGATVSFCSCGTNSGISNTHSQLIGYLVLDNTLSAHRTMLKLFNSESMLLYLLHYYLIPGYLVLIFETQAGEC